VSRRTQRLNRAIQQEISRILEKDINDPRLSGLISITGVFTSEDLRHVRVYNLRMRHAPDFAFEYDDSIERGTEVLRIMEGLTRDS
jgi:ribosome-binding factor A